MQAAVRLADGVLHRAGLARDRGCPAALHIHGGSLSGGGGLFRLALPSLTLSMTANNWLLLRHPSLYLYAVGYEAAKYLRDLELAQATKALLEMEFAEVAAVDASARYSRARIILPGVTP